MTQGNGMAVMSPAELSGLFDPQSEGSLTRTERGLIAALLANEDRMDVAIPDTIDSDSLWDALALCCKVQSRVRRVQSVLKMLVGRALILLEGRPAMYKDRGFVSLDAFLSDEEKGLPAITGISRAELYNAKKIAKAFPALPAADYAQIGFGKLLDISKVVTGADSNAQEWLDAAKSGTQKELREKIYASDNNIAPGSLELVAFSMMMTKAERDEIQEFLDSAEYQAYCKSALPGIMLTTAIAESTTEWKLAIREEQER